VKKILIFTSLLLLLLVIGYRLLVRNWSKNSLELVENRSENSQELVNKQSKISPKQDKLRTTSYELREKRSLFIPYWNVNIDASSSAGYDRFFYFGVTPGHSGLNRNDVGYINLELFNKNSAKKSERYLVLRMLDDEINQIVLDNLSLQNKICDDLIILLKQYGLQGVAIDLEIGGIATEKSVAQVNKLVATLSSRLRPAYQMSLIVYGDAIYRRRPFDLRNLTPLVDEVLVMAYDFHKSRGEPGPNFPYGGRDKYGYDFQTMVGDYLKFVLEEKLTVIFGMFGYDWTVDEKKRPIAPATALTLNRIRSEFLGRCQWQDCIVKRDELSGETEVNYVYSTVKDNYGSMDLHIVWFEDETSTQLKAKWLKGKGIASVAFWAWGYF